MLQLKILSQTQQSTTIAWQQVPQAVSYTVLWSDRQTAHVRYKTAGSTQQAAFCFTRSTHIPYYLKVQALDKNGALLQESEVLQTPVARVLSQQLEALSRGLVAVKANTGIFVSWRLFKNEVNGFCSTGLTGTDFAVYKNGEKLAVVTDSTNYLDKTGKDTDRYAVAPIVNGVEAAACHEVGVWEKGCYELPLQKPAGGVTPSGQAFEYHANDMSVGDVDGDGEYEYFVKWDPDNSQDVSIKGYTGNCIIDCYRLDGTLLWRLDMGKNIRAGAHYTQFMVYDFNGDGRAEMAVKTAPGTCMTRFAPDGTVLWKKYITMPKADVQAGYSHLDNYVCSAEDYRLHMAEVFADWHKHPEVICGRWPKTLEECFGIEQKYSYPLSWQDALELADYFIDIYAPSRSPRNELRKFEGFIYEGPEYLTMFGGNGEELDTIPYKFPRVDDGLLWGDYAMARIEPCNRVDRFNAGVAYLDGERPYLIACRGYYTRATLVAYDFFENRFRETWSVDSGFVPMNNPFNASACHTSIGSDPVYGILAGQGNHSIATADVDGDGCMEIIYGAAVIDHDGGLLYSSYGELPNGKMAKFGHGDAMHVADIDPDSPGLDIFNVFEEGKNAPYGWALRDAETGKARFGEYAEEDLGRCMIGKIDPNTRGLQVWVKEVYDVQGNALDLPVLGTNMRIYWAGDLSTQITDGQDYLHETKSGVINDLTHGVMLVPEGTATNNGTKGNPCLVADVLGDFREELLVRAADDSAIHIYTTTDLTAHKLFTLMHDAQYRCGVAWQNNCYNQPGYPSFYYATDMDFAQVMPQLSAKPTLWLAGDSIMQSYCQADAPQTGWGQVLASLAKESEVCSTAHRESSPFAQQCTYTLPGLVIDNCAMAGRSSRTFREEGRLDDIAAHIKSGDFLVVSFGHNDANEEKPERFVPLDSFGESLAQYLKVAREKGAVCIFASPVAMREFDAGRTCPVSFAAYRAAMQAFAQQNGVPFIDLGALTAAANTVTGAEHCKERYMWIGDKQDDAHLQTAGALRVASAFIQGLHESNEPTLHVLKQAFSV